jgi:excinuclease ABC subunit A
MLFASTPAAAANGLRKADFSTAGGRGRCADCNGLGRTRVSMDFLPDVWLTCETCGGTRYGLDVRACTIDGRTIADVLELTVDEALVALGDRLSEQPPRGRRSGASLSRPTQGASSLAVLRDMGLGYIRLGQPVRTLSGGERQRLLLATSLLATGAAPMLYLFDEPTTGLHPDDVHRLMHVFDRLIAAGHTVVVVEHNLDVIGRADWVIDLGPEGGRDGGQLVAAGPPDLIAACAGSYTGLALQRSRAV